MFYYSMKRLNTRTYTDNIMATKTISISEEAYEKLKGLKASEKGKLLRCDHQILPQKKKAL